MSPRSRILLPSAMGTRTCSRWACLQRILGSGANTLTVTAHSAGGLREGAPGPCIPCQRQPRQGKGGD
jgi:hypothetical protein